MHLFKLLTFLTALVAFGTSCPTNPTLGLRVKTTSAVLAGFVNPSTPDVRQFLGVPFSLPPTGSRRWLPPSKILSNAQITANDIGPACPQLTVDQSISFKSSVYSATGGNQTEYFPLPGYSEDCLTLNVWAPRKYRQEMPVIVWFFGGGFTQGGTNSLYFNPEKWVQRTQEHIMVTVNFRSNIFGFPNAPGLLEQNLGLLDQRLALEWVRDNIASFGGSPSKIVDWGESAGAVAVDYLDLAYPSDPIVSGKIMDTTTGLEPSTTTNFSHSNFTAVAKHFGCQGCSTIECMRNISSQDIEDYLSQHQTTESPDYLQFTPVPDERIVFSNYTQRYAMGAFSWVPAIIGTNQYELNALGKDLPESVLVKQGNASYLCVAALASQFRKTYSRTTYRFLYEGNFTNISPPKFSGAYHASELPQIMGTAGSFHGPSTEYEKMVSMKMQDLWLAFAKDPVSGLSRAGWGPYEERKAVVLGDGKSAMREIDIFELDGVCPITGF